MAETEPDAPRERADVMRWRRAERKRLIDLRFDIPSAERRRFGERIAAAALELLGDIRGSVVSAYWPFRGEPDLRELLRAVAERGGRTALPVVAEKRAPLVFRTWSPGEKLERGVWNIPVPAAGAEVTPEIVISPVVGFDPACYRLGYGGGYYDRTLAALSPAPRAIGVGYEQAAIPTIHAQWHDIPMDAIVTEDRVLTPA